MARATTKVSKVAVAGPLAPFAAAVTSRLAELGYTPLTRVNVMRLVAHLSQWLEAAGMTASDLTGQRLEEYFGARRAAGRTASRTPASVAVLLEVLAGLGVLPAAAPPADACSEDGLLGSFRRYLLAERALQPSTAAAYVDFAGRFLAGCAPRGPAELTSADVTRAVLDHSAAVSVSLARYFLVGLRCFLRFCVVEGLAPTDLSAAALPVAGRARPGLPRGISRADALALLRSCDRRGALGRRDYAVLLTLLRLGLRAGEVAALTLEDLDWRAGELVVHGKGGRHDRLPLPADVGQAIAAYLQRGRPKATSREVFLRAIAPVGPVGRGAVSDIVRRACARAGVAPMGAHRLRHTLACDMTAAGVPLPQISLVLRHGSVSSTAVYARVDVDRLRTLAQPWPQGNGS